MNLCIRVLAQGGSRGSQGTNENSHRGKKGKGKFRPRARKKAKGRKGKGLNGSKKKTRGDWVKGCWLVSGSVNGDRTRGGTKGGVQGVGSRKKNVQVNWEWGRRGG